MYPDAQRVRTGRAISAFLGAVCILVGVLLSPFVVERLIAADGRIESWAIRFTLFGLQAVFGVGGVYLLKSRPAFDPANTLLASGSALAALVVGSAILQFAYRPPVLTLGWRYQGPRSEMNELGYRGHSIAHAPDDYVIVLLGDSQVQATACAFDWMPERRLEHHLKKLGKEARVISLGANGYGQDQQLLALRGYLARSRADLVILWETPSNDIWNNIFPSHWPANGAPKPTFRLNGSELVGPSGHIGDTLHVSSLHIIAMLKHAMSWVRWDEEWERHLPPAYLPMTEYRGPVDSTWQRMWDANERKFRLENVGNEKSHLAFQLTPRSPRMAYGIKLTRALRQVIESEVQGQEGEFAVFRTAFTDSLDAAMIKDAVYVLNGRYYRTSRAQAEANIREINSGFRQFEIPVTLSNPRVGPGDSHLNQQAVDQVMRDLALQLEDIVSNHVHRSQEEDLGGSDEM